MVAAGNVDRAMIITKRCIWGPVSLQTASIPVAAETAETPTLPRRGGTDRGQESVIKPCWQGGCMGDRRVTD